MTFIVAAVLVLLNLGFLVLNAFGLPGNWLMVGATALVAWIFRDQGLFSIGTLVAIAALAVAGEVIELLASVAGSKRAGGSRAGAFGALAGALLGGIFGQGLIPVPIVGAILGVCLGAFLGAVGGELLAGRSIGESLRSGQGAAVGRFVGTVGKLGVGGAIFLIVAVAAFWP